MRMQRRQRMTLESCSIEIAGQEIAYTLQRSTRRRRTIQIQLDPENGFKVLVPHTLTHAEVEDFLLKRSDWILKHRSSERNLDEIRDWGEGGTAMLRGKPIQVVIEERDDDDLVGALPPTVVKSLEGNRVAVTIPPGLIASTKASVVKRWLTEWYKQEAWDFLNARVSEIGNVMGVQPSQLKLSNAKKRWGSCSGKRSVNLNWRLIMLEDSLIDYVVVHELAHLIELNHSPSFWQVVEGVLPEHKELRKKLREHAPTAFG